MDTDSNDKGPYRTVDNGSVGQGVVGQIGQQIWMGRVGHGLVSVTHDTLTDDKVNYFKNNFNSFWN